MNTETIVIGGVSFIIRALNANEIMRLTTIDGQEDPVTMISYIVTAGTVDPKIENIDNVSVPILMRLATKIQEITLRDINDALDIHVEEKDNSPNPFVV